MAVSLTGSVAEPRGYAKMRQCDTAGRPLRNAEQYRYGIRTTFFWWVRDNVKLSRSNAGCLDVPDVEVCTSPARELPQADHSPRIGKARLMRRGTDCRNAVIDPADSDYSFKGVSCAWCSSKSVKCTEVSARRLVLVDRSTASVDDDAQLKIRRR